MDAPLFIHLRLRSSYSLLEGAMRMDALGGLCREAQMPALALTDNANLFGAMEFSQKLAERGIQPILGCTMPVAVPGAGHKRARAAPLALLVKDEAGYRNLIRLSSAAYDDTEGDAGRVGISFDALSAHAEGLICLTGGPDGFVNRLVGDGQMAEAAALLDKLRKAFPDRLYLELQRHGLPAEDEVEPWLLEQAEIRHLPLVATNDVYFSDKDMFEAHDALLCIAQNARVDESDRRRVSPEHYFKSSAEMAELFADLPDALARTVEIAERCAYRLAPKDPVLPRFQKGDESEALRKRAADGLASRLAALGEARAAPESVYQDRLAHELDIIIKMRFAGYFLIVADFVQWAQGEGIPVGPGRGSGAGSLVAYALQITDLDPLRFNLLFERFMNPERVSLPDFDIDFCQERRDEVIRYVRKRYGEKRVANIITFGTLQARAALRDVGRVLGLPYGQVDRLCKFVPFNPAQPVSLAEAIKREPALQQAQKDDPQVARMMRIGSRLEGLHRHASTHAAGIVIGDTDLDEGIPLARDPKSGARLTQFSMNWVEKAGLVKFDFLGLKTLTALRITQTLLARKGTELNLSTLPLDDAKTYELLGSGETTGLFQLESSGVRQALRQLRPDRFEDIIALVALYRPGPMDNIPLYINCKHGKEEPDYLHPTLKPLLEETFGVIIYQEQVMQIAQILSGYSLAEADLLRRAMGKKIKSEMDKQEARFIEGAEAKSVPRARAHKIFNLVQRFAGYGFNKSHAAAYALIAYQTAWLKTHHPTEYLAALMTLDMGNPEKLAQFRREADRLDIPVAAPDINRSEDVFIVREGTILHALSAIRNVGTKSVRDIVAARASGEAFRDVFDFAERTDPKGLNKRMIEGLAMAGTFDSIHPNRKQIFTHADKLLAASQRAQAQAESQQERLFGEDAAPDETLPDCADWGKTEKLAHEFASSGLYLSGHPLDAEVDALDAAGIVPIDALKDPNRTEARIAGVITAIQNRRSKRGTPFAFATLCDRSGIGEVIIFSELLNQNRALVEVGNIVFADVEIAHDAEGRLGLRVQSLGPLAEGLSHRAQPARNGAGVPPAPQPSQSPHPAHMTVFLDGEESVEEVLAHLKEELHAPGPGRVRVIVSASDGAEVEIRLPGGFALSAGLKSALGGKVGITRIEMQ